MTAKNGKAKAMWYTQPKMIFTHRVEMPYPNSQAPGTYCEERYIERFCKTLDEAIRYSRALISAGKPAYVVARSF